MDVIEDIRRILMSGIASVDPAVLVRRALSMEGRQLRIRIGGQVLAYDLSNFAHLVLIGFGKASLRMAEGLDTLLQEEIEEGLIVTTGAQEASCNRCIEVVEGGHPLPDARSCAAGQKMLRLAEKTRGQELGGEHTLVIALISGGGSALLAAPADGLSLEDKAATTKLLLDCGATIQEMNTVRKHLSAVKGGRLAEAFAPATLLSLVLSDVVGDDLDSIASGPTVPDVGSWDSARSVLQSHGIWNAVPPHVRSRILDGIAGSIPDTPRADSAIFENAKTFIIGNNKVALEGAAEKARELGYNALVFSSCITGEARSVAELYHGLAKDIERVGRPLEKPACLIAGGETTVTIHGDGLGGRNQELALALLASLDPEEGVDRKLVFLAAGTDGIDGPTDAAGAYATMNLRTVALQMGEDPGKALARNDSYHFFSRIGGLLKTGPTGTNVCDMHLLIVP
ncbi:MAG: glycerate kinase [Spirochaetaceae bacterium]|nr:glycerate kinase [Spirochaetaceae bacterium]